MQPVLRDWCTKGCVLCYPDCACNGTLVKESKIVAHEQISFFATKTVCMHICQKRSLHLDPQLFLDKIPIPIVEETKFLGVIFDRSLSFIHLKYVKKKGLKALNIFKLLGNTEWGAD